MKQPNTWLARTDIRTAESAISSLESTLLGFHLTGDTADEVRTLAYRLLALTEPRKGYLDHDKPGADCARDTERAVDAHCAAAGMCARETADAA